MSKEAFREFIKADRIKRKVPNTSSETEKPNPNSTSIPKSKFLASISQDKEMIGRERKHVGATQLLSEIPERSSCVVEIRNRIPSALTQPRFYCCYGECHDLLSDIPTFSTEAFAFKNNSPLLSGIFSYRIQNQFLWVMYSIYEERNYFVMGLTESKENETLSIEQYVTMASDIEWRYRPDKKFTWAKNGVMTIQRGNVLVTSQMSTDVKCILNIEISSGLQ